jgi:hypothetical protein
MMITGTSLSWPQPPRAASTGASFSRFAARQRHILIGDAQHPGVEIVEALLHRHHDDAAFKTNP